MAISWIKTPFNHLPHNYLPSRTGSLLVLLLPILSLIKFNLGGELFLSETILLLALPVLLLKRKKILLPRSLSIVIILGFIWLFGQIISDLILETPFEDFIRGWAKISFFLIALLSLGMLLTTPLRILLFFSTLTIPFFIRPFIFGLAVPPIKEIKQVLKKITSKGAK